MPLSTILGRSFAAGDLFLYTGLLFVVKTLVSTLTKGFTFLLVNQTVRKVKAKVTLPLVFGVVLRRMPRDEVNFVVKLTGVVAKVTPTVKPAFNKVIIDDLN